VTFSIGQKQSVAGAVAYSNPNTTQPPTQALEDPGTPIKATDSPSFGHLSSFSGNRRFQLEGRIVF